MPRFTIPVTVEASDADEARTLLERACAGRLDIELPAYEVRYIYPPCDVCGYDHLSGLPCPEADVEPLAALDAAREATGATIAAIALLLDLSTQLWDRPSAEGREAAQRARLRLMELREVQERRERELARELS